MFVKRPLDTSNIFINAITSNITINSAQHEQLLQELRLNSAAIKKYKDSEYHVFDQIELVFDDGVLAAIHVKNKADIASKLPYGITSQSTMKDFVCKFAPVEPNKGKVSKRVYLKYPEYKFMVEFIGNDYVEELVWDEIVFYNE